MQITAIPRHQIFRSARITVTADHTDTLIAAIASRETGYHLRDLGYDFGLRVDNALINLLGDLAETGRIASYGDVRNPVYYVA